MANPEKGEVAVDVDGTRYTLRPSFNAICELDELLGGMSLNDLQSHLTRGSVSGLRSVVWCLLQADHESEIKTLKDAGNWIERAGGVEVVMPLVNRALELNAPEGESASDGARPRGARVGTGARSLPRRAR